MYRETRHIQNDFSPKHFCIGRISRCIFHVPNILDMWHPSVRIMILVTLHILSLLSFLLFSVLCSSLSFSLSYISVCFIWTCGIPKMAGNTTLIQFIVTIIWWYNITSFHHILPYPKLGPFFWNWIRIHDFHFGYSLEPHSYSIWPYTAKLWSKYG